MESPEVRLGRYFDVIINGFNDFNRSDAIEPIRLDHRLYLLFEPIRQGKKLKFFAQFSMADPSEF